jgi:nickel transport protein
MATGYWTKTVWGTVNRSKDTQRAVVDSWRSEEWVKRLEVWTPALRQPVSSGLELSPQTDPFHLGPGDELRLRATLKGAPTAGVAVAYDGQPQGMTDDEGRIDVRIRHGGGQMISGSLETPLLDAKADRLLRTAILQFDLPPP